MFLKGVWFIIAGVLVLGQTPVLAEPYLKVCKNGVEYYHYTSREPSHLRQAGKNTAKPRGEAWIQVPAPRQKQPSAASQAALRVKAKVKPETVAAVSAPALMPLLPETAVNLPVVNPYGPKSMILAGTDYLLRLLTKLGCRFPLDFPAFAGLQAVGRHQEVHAVQAPRLVVPEGWKNLLKYAQEQPADPGRVQQSMASLKEPDLPGYKFPVAGPFSFRDTWGEGRSGGRIHKAADIFAPEGTEVYAITAGVIDSLATLNEAGITLFLRGQDGRGYGYMHLQGYAAGLAEGKVVRTGELIGYVGRTGIQWSAAHLHLQVYADHRLCKDALLNPYSFLVQLCHGIGVTDLYQQKIARVEEPGARVKGIQVYKRHSSVDLRGRVGQFSVKNSSVTVIKNF